MSGLIGRAIRPRLQAGYELRALNRSRVEGVPCHQADISDLAAIEPAFQGADVVVHLAGSAHGAGSWDEILHHNVVGTRNVLEAARRAGVRRVVYASSGATVSACERDEPWASLAAGRYAGLTTWPIFTHESPVRPAGLYGVSKVFGETLGRQYADAHGLSVVCLRIGAVNPEDRPTDPRDYSVWLSQRDVTQAIERAIAAPASLGYAVCFLTSDNKWSYRDIAHTRTVLDWAPEDRAEDFRHLRGPRNGPRTVP
jgi:nucleoside-diphosphate-sugar epimerase